MSRLKSILGYIVAAIGIPLVLATFIGMQPFSEVLVDLTGVKISPWITGGDVQTTLDHGSYQTQIYQPVFRGLLADRKEGFVQIVWTPTTTLPQSLEEEIDYNQDGQADFKITLNPQAKTAYSSDPIQLSGPYRIGDGIGVRVTLKHP